jgi:nitrogenase molybdenum-iron protein NifN
MAPVLCASAARTPALAEALQAAARHSREPVQLMADSDFESVFEAAQPLAPDLVLGSSKAHTVARRLGVPLVRLGFPIHDRFGGQRLLHLGYRGAQQMYDRIVNALLERQQESSPVGFSYQ